MRGEFQSYTFLNLFPGQVSSVAGDLMKSGVNPDSEVPVHVVTPPVRGLGFLTADGEEARRLNAWWEQSVPADSLPVVVTMHEPELQRYLPGLDAEFVIGAVSEADLSLYAGLANVRATAIDSALALTEYAMQAYAVAAGRCFRTEFPYRAWRLDGEPARGQEPATIEPGADRIPFVPRDLPDLPPPIGAMPAPSAAPAAGPAAITADQVPDPFGELSKSRRQAVPLTRAQLLAGARAGNAATGPRAGNAGPAATQLRSLGGLFSLGRRRPIDVPREIGDLVLSLRPAPVVAVVSRAGGVGKTAVAAALAQVVGYSIGDTTGSAAIVDQNIGNPDQWGRLDIPAQTATVRALMASLSSGADLPRAPAWASTPALAVYPEDRESAEPYSPGLIQRFLQYMRERHVFTVVDLPNRLPDASSAEGAICAFYLDVADLVIMPTTDDPSRLLGVLEYLDTPSLKGKPAIVSYIVSPDRKLRSHPRVVELLDSVRSRASSVVTVPKSEKATLAIVEGVSILDVSPQLRNAYVQLALTTVRALAG